MLPEIIKHYLSIHWWHLCMFVPLVLFIILMLLREYGLGDNLAKRFDDVFADTPGIDILGITFGVAIAMMGSGITLLVVK